MTEKHPSFLQKMIFSSLPQYCTSTFNHHPPVLYYLALFLFSTFKSQFSHNLFFFFFPFFSLFMIFSSCDSAIYPMGGGGIFSNTVQYEYVPCGVEEYSVLLVSPLCEPIAQQVTVYGMTYISGPW
jgi:hypothetical protein